MIKENNLQAVICAAGDRVVVEDGHRQLTGKQLDAAVQAVAETFKRCNSRRIALRADNGINWIVADLAAKLNGCTLIPIPLFFSIGQAAHAIKASGCDTLLSDAPDFIASLTDEVAPVRMNTDMRVRLVDSLCLQPLLSDSTPPMPEGTDKVTFTSGSTGAPKGVCLSDDHQLRVAVSLADAINISRPRHLCVLPLSTLLENIAGIYAPLLAGGRVVVPALEELGMQGSSGLDPNRLLQKITEVQPVTMILVPELLTVLVRSMEHGWEPPSSLQFVAVGGGKVSAAAILQARNMGLPVYEGYGLSECGSVVSLNRPGNDNPGSAGRPLPHVDVSVRDGELIVKGAGFLGYLDDPESWKSTAIATGDLGQIDGFGFVHIQGRSKNQLISSFGRNISPEWIESELTASAVLQQAVVVGDAQPFCSALVYAGSHNISNEKVDQWIDEVNSKLPDYARIRQWLRLSAPMSVANKQLTENGRLRRAQIHSDYTNAISHFYNQQPQVA